MSPTAVERRIAEKRASIMPLESFPPDMRREIEDAVAAPEPPPRWIHFGAPDSRWPLAAIESRAWIEWHYQRGVDPYGRRDSIPAAVREAVLHRDGYVCQLCGGDVEPSDVHLDHIYPFSKGGATTVANLQVTHSRCNLRKGARV